MRFRLQTAPPPAYLAEFIGTYFLVLTVGCNAIFGNPTWSVMSVACVFTVLIYALADVSGGNFNPAVTLALGLAKRKPWAEVGLYMVMQITAAICASLTYSIVYKKAFTLGPKGAYSGLAACVCEMLYTFMLCFVVLNVAASWKSKQKLPNQYYALAIGFVLVAGGYGAGAISGGVFNPAAAVGIELATRFCWVTSVQGVQNLLWLPAYIVCEFLGAALAADMFRVVRPHEYGAVLTPLVVLTSRLVSEFIGTFLLVLTVGLNVLVLSKGSVISIAASFTSMIYALSDVSGANFNPAVSAAVALRGKLAMKDAAMYAAVQLFAGTVAGIVYVKIVGRAFPLGPSAGFDYGSVAVVETLFTFALCFVVLAVTTTKKGLPDFFGLVIGLSVTAGGYAIGAVSGGSLNPAVSFGIVAGNAMKGGSFGALAYYIVPELLAGCLAALIFKVTHPPYSLGSELQDAGGAPSAVGAAASFLPSLPFTIYWGPPPVPAAAGDKPSDATYGSTDPPA